VRRPSAPIGSSLFHEAAVDATPRSASETPTRRWSDRIRTAGPSRARGRGLRKLALVDLSNVSPTRGSTTSAREGPRVRISFPPPASLSHQCLPCLPPQRPGFCRECEPGRDQRTGRAGPEPARLGCFSLTGIAAVPPFGKSKRSNEKSPGLGLGTLCCGSPFSSPGGCADRSNRAADRVR